MSVLHIRVERQLQLTGVLQSIKQYRMTQPPTAGVQSRAPWLLVFSSNQQYVLGAAVTSVCLKYVLSKSEA
jgi:hypothetical protein